MIVAELIQAVGTGGSGAGFTLNRVPDYSHTGTQSGVTYKIKAWLNPSVKLGIIQIDAIGTASAEIDVELPPLTTGPDLDGAGTQSMFLNIFEYDDNGGQITGVGIIGGVALSRDGSMRLWIKQDAAIISGSSDFKSFRMQ